MLKLYILCQQLTKEPSGPVTHNISMEKEIKKYQTYEDYLDSLMVEDDQKYLGDVETARQLVQERVELVKCMGGRFN